MANKRYDAMNTLLHKWYKEKSQDMNIIRGLYSSSNLQQNEIVDRSEDLKKGTKYSSLTNDEFVSLFKADTFSALDKTGLKHLFQELHNRYIGEKGYDITRNVTVVSDKGESAYGYVCANDDLMFINKYAIDQAKKVEPSEKNFNKTNLGYSLLYVLSHESQHVAQFESAIDYALGVKQDKDTAFVAAMTAIENTNMAYDDAHNSQEFLFNWNTHYNYQFIEHNANYSAFQKAREMIPDSEKQGKSYAQYDAFTTLLALRESPSLVRDSKEFIENRINSMEEFAKYEIDFFRKNIKNCPMKKQILATCDEFMKVDENGNSLFRDKLTKEIGEMTEVCKNAKKELFKDKKNHKKLNKQISKEVELIQL